MAQYESMAKVALRGMKFYAFHGYYEFERRVGCNFILDVEATVTINADPGDQIEKTINYEDLYRICQQYMQLKYKLLESVAYDIAAHIKREFEVVDHIKVTLSKLNPPLPGKVDKSVIEIEL